MARRARGAGAVFQRADAGWEAQLRIGPQPASIAVRAARHREAGTGALVDGSGIASQNASHPDPR